MNGQIKPTNASHPWILQGVAYADANTELVNAFSLVSHGSSKSTLWNNTSAAGSFDITVPSGSITFQSVANGVYHHRYWNDNPNAAIADGFPLNGLNHVQISLLGDPTLRLHVVDPVELSTPSVSSSTVTLNWTASADLTGTLDSGEGYYIYRAWGKSGPFKKLNTTPVQTTQYIDTSVPKGIHTYMVRACKLEGYRTGDMSTGNYYNLSQGVTYRVDVPNGANWTYTELTKLSGSSDYSLPYAINNAATIEVAGYAPSGSGYWQAQVWRSGPAPNRSLSYNQAFAYGINDNGVVVGTADTYAGGYGSYIQAFRWQNGGSIQLLNHLPNGGSFSEAASVNNDLDPDPLRNPQLPGTVAGYGKNPSGYYRALRWKAGENSPDDLQTFYGDNTLDKSSYGYCVNKAGYIVGSAQKSVGGTVYFRGFLLLPGERLKNTSPDLGTLGGNNSDAYFINDLGYVVGRAQISGGAYRPFIREPEAASLTNIGLPSGATGATPNGINNSAVVVGTASGSSQFPFIWQDGMSVPRDLRNYCSVAYRTFLSAEAINDSCKIVGCVADNLNGGYHGFILTPP